jgi:hypothetical protein
MATQSPDEPRLCKVFDHFVAETGLWIDTLPDGGSAVIHDAPFGILTILPSDGSVADNDEAYRASAHAVFLFAGGPIYAKARLKFTDTVTASYNCVFCLADAIGPNLLLDDGKGMRASGSLAALYKADGRTAWSCATRVGDDTAFVSHSIVSAQSTGFQDLEILVDDLSRTQIRVSFKVNGQVVVDREYQPITHRLPIAGAALMQVGVGAKIGNFNGGAPDSSDALLVDYIWAHQA